MRCDHFLLNFDQLHRSDEFSLANVNEALFERIKDFKNCQLNVVAVETEPFLVVNRSTPELTVSGIEVFLLELLEERLNFTAKIVHPPNKEQRGLVYPNGTVTGAIKMVTHA